MPIYHSKTWPTSTMAVVQLRVDQQGRAFSALADDNIDQDAKIMASSEAKFNGSSGSKLELGSRESKSTSELIFSPKSNNSNRNKVMKENKKSEYAFPPVKKNKKCKHKAEPLNPSVTCGNHRNTPEYAFPPIPNSNYIDIESRRLPEEEVVTRESQRTTSEYQFPPTSNACTLNCIRSEREADFKRCDCQFSHKTSSNGNGLVCKYNEDNLKFIHDAKQFLKSRIKEDARATKSRKSQQRSDSNMTVSTILRSNSCDSNFVYNFNRLNKLRKSLDRSTDSLELSSRSNIFNSKICYCIQLLALSPNSLLNAVQFPSKSMERRCSISSSSSVCKWTPKRTRDNPKAKIFAKGRSKSVSHMVADKINPSKSSIFRRCNSTIEAPKRRESELDEKDLTNGGANLPKTPLSARKTQTLYRHYYPEGGWGWTILVVCIVVSILDHGMQLAAAVLVHPAMEKFKVSSMHASECFGKHQFDHELLQAEDSGLATSGDVHSCDLDYQELDFPGFVQQESPETVKPKVYIDNTPKTSHRLSSGGHSSECSNTIKQHYYPEGGWGWVTLTTGTMALTLTHGLQTAVGIWIVEIARKHPKEASSANIVRAGWLGALSTAVALFISPVTVACCLRKSTRVTAVMGGLVAALGCLFTSFASQFHQLFFSYGAVVGVGVGLARDCATLMVAQYFKRRREMVEIFVVSGSGLGIAIMSAFIKGAITAKGWRLGLQAVTGVVFLTFILGTFYRSASLYHPQRRAILHLKNQNKIKRKIKDKTKVDESPPFFDFSSLKSKTVRILLLSTSITSFGINTPIFYMAHQAEEDGFGDSMVLLQVYLGLAWACGCGVFGLYIMKSTADARIARQYLCQAAIFMCGLSILAFTIIQSNYHAYVAFAWVYGIFCGGYHYTLKMYTYERVRSRNFARTWGFVQCSQAIPIALGVPMTGYINVGCGGKAGYYFSSTCVIIGSLALFFIDLHRRNISRHKHTSQVICESRRCPQRHPSFSREPDREPSLPANAAAAAIVLGADIGIPTAAEAHSAPEMKPELTCISEEGLADMDLPDNLIDDLDYLGDCITSCNKVENYLMLSEYENNLVAEMPMILDRKGRKWSLARGNVRTVGIGGVALTTDQPSEHDNGISQMPSLNSYGRVPKWKHTPQHTANSRLITVIDEASV